ncbi:MAG: 2'-5' RNA ligase family protein [Patescibacteria group bacterium]|mgnify:CR=1 FL=1
MINKIILPTHPQPDTAVAISLLKIFGRERYPGIENASVEIMPNLPSGETAESLERQGVLAIDLGGGKLDHHSKNTTASYLVAADLDRLEYAPIAKLLAYAERDDKYGKGTISEDPLDRAFGLSGLISVLNKAFPNQPNEVVSWALSLVWAHYLEEKRRLEDIPQEFEKKIDAHEAEVFEIRHKGKRAKAVLIRSDNPSMVGWLRSNEGVKADIVAQRTSAGYINILTRQIKHINLSFLAALLREEEARVRGRALNALRYELARPGRVDEVPEWYYDRATNSLLNGSLNQKGIPPTAVSLEKMKDLITRGLGEIAAERKPRPMIPQTNNYFLEIRVPLEAAEEMRGFLPENVTGFKLHRSENYHLTLLYLGSYHTEELINLKEAVAQALRDQKPFRIFFSGENFRSGIVPGYPGKSFYFEIKSEPARGCFLSIKSAVENAVPRFEKQEFGPHITIATAIRNVNERVAEDTKLEIAKDSQIDFLVNKIRLTEVRKGPVGETTYSKSAEFFLGGS